MTKPKPKASSNRVSAAKRKRTRKPPVLTFPAGTFAKPVEAALSAADPAWRDRLSEATLPVANGGVVGRPVCVPTQPRTLAQRVWDFAPKPRWAWWLLIAGSVALTAALLVKGAGA